MASLSAGIEVKDALKVLKLGQSVAEFDNSLEKYFVENHAYHSLISDEADFIAGDKGTGKTAVYKILQKRYSITPELKDVEVIEGFNPSGNPVFQRLVQQDIETLTEGQYVSVWKAYIFSLVGNWLIDIYGKDCSPKFSELYHLLEKSQLISLSNKPESIFNKIVGLVQRVFRPESSETSLAISETGLPIITQKFTFKDSDAKNSEQQKEISYEEALELLDVCLSETGFSLWIALDRLDEAFQGYPDIEIPALRALLRTYLDLLAFKRFKMKVFVRRDLFRKIVGKSFVNLTHINARKVEILWDPEDLLNLLVRRVKDSREFVELMETDGCSDEDIFYKIFTDKVDMADRKPTTLNWIMSRISDGNEVRAPRNLIDLVNKAASEQLRAEGRNSRTINRDGSLIMPESLRQALSRLSEQRVQDTLLAEVGPEISGYILKFTKEKADHDINTLGDLLSIEGDQLQYAIKQLVEVGFLEESKSSWKVPMLYRDGLGIKQGKAYD